ncbi:MAG: hypothetical protein HQL13_03800 [Candidatus Omnitrophica bacterium]|nr:hypothetical protein [Candidatus Omnitrophota bacterium]
MRKGLLPLLFFLLPRIVQKITQSPQGCQNVPRLRMKLFYLRFIKLCRLLFLSCLGIGISLVFLLSSIIIFNIALFLYAPLSMETKMWVGFFSAAVYLWIGIAAFVFVFSQKKWLYMFNAQNILKNEGEKPSLKKTDLEI